MSFGNGLRQLLSFANPQRGTIIFVFVVGAISVAASLAQPAVVGFTVDAISAGDSIKGPIFLFSLLFVVDAGLLGVQSYLIGRAGADIVLDIRRNFIAHLMRLHIGAHDRLRTGDLLSRASTDTTILREILTIGVVEASLGIITLAGALVLMLVIDWVLLSAVILSLLLPATAVLYLSPKLRAASKETQESVGNMSAAMEKALNAVRTVKASRAESRETEHIYQEALAAREAEVRAARINAFMGPAVDLTMQASFVLVLGLGGLRLAVGAISVAELIAFLLYLLFLIGPVAQISEFVGALQQGLAAVQRINEIFALPAAIEGDGEEKRARRREAKSEKADPHIVTFDSVTFAYDMKRHILREVSFQVRERTKTALVGPSGAGKTTVFGLLERFYDVGSGSILFEGTDIRSLPLEYLRNFISYVEQDCPMLSGSIRSNLLYANPAASEEELERALDSTNLRPFVERLPEGLDTKVGDGGILVSGGERQRIAIARALLAKPKLLLLDEVTSQLDAENEKALRKTMHSVAKECTVMVIAHRISTVADAEKILVFDNGKICSAGTHEELLRSEPLYRELAREQLVV